MGILGTVITLIISIIILAVAFPIADIGYEKLKNHFNPKPRKRQKQEKKPLDKPEVFEKETNHLK